MKLLSILFVVFLMGLLLWYSFTRKIKPEIIFMIDGAFFKSNNILIRYNSVIKVEKDIPFSFMRNNYGTSFVITYSSGNGMINSIRYNMKFDDQENWELFKRKVLAENPAVEFDESIL